MKSKHRPLFQNSIIFACTSVMLAAFHANARDLFWRAEVNPSGNRDGAWDVITPSWSLDSSGPADTNWNNDRFSIAYFTAPESVTATVSGWIGLKGLVSNTSAAVAIVNGTLGFSYSPVIELNGGAVSIGSTVTCQGGSLVKKGNGLLEISGRLEQTNLIIESGPVLLSGTLPSFSSSIQNSGTLTVSGNRTIGSYTQDAGELAGGGTLTASNFTIYSGKVSGNAAGGGSGGNTFIEGDVEISGHIGTAGIEIRKGTLTFAGTTTAQRVTLRPGTSMLNTSGGLNAKQTTLNNAGSLTMTGDDSVYTYNHSGLLLGTGRLTAEKTAFLSSGEIAGNLSGTILNQGNVLVSGNIAGSDLLVQSGTLTLAGTSTHVPVNISTGAVLLDSNGGLDALAKVTNYGTLTVTGNDTVSTYTQSNGTLDGTGTLTVTGNAWLHGGTMAGNLTGNSVTTRTDTMISGSVGGGSLTVESGNLTLTGSSTNTTVSISDSGMLTDEDGGLDSRARITNQGVLIVNSDQVVSTYTQIPGNFWSDDNPRWQTGDPTLDPMVSQATGIRGAAGLLAGTGQLTATDGANLTGGSVQGNLWADDMTASGEVGVFGKLGGVRLSVSDGTLNIRGSVRFSTIEIAESGRLISDVNRVDDATDILNSGYVSVSGLDVIHSLTNSGGRVEGTMSVTGPTTFNGGSLGDGLIDAAGGALLHGGTVIHGQISGNTSTYGDVTISGRLSDGVLQVRDGRLALEGSSTNGSVMIAQAAALVDTGDLGDTSVVSNSGLLTIHSKDIIGSLSNGPGALVNGNGHLVVTGHTVFNGGTLAGKLTARSGVSLIEGASITGVLNGDATTSGNVDISGTMNGGSLHVRSGTLELSGRANAFTRVSLGATLRGSGTINGDLSNNGTIGVGSSGDHTLNITGSLATDGLVSLSLGSASDFGRIKVGGIASLAGDLLVTNQGEGLAPGEVAEIIRADSFVGGFETFTASGFTNGVLFDDANGRLIGMAGGTAGSFDTYLNLNRSQTDVYLSLYEDSVETGAQNVTKTVLITGSGGARLRAVEKASVVESIEFTSGLSDGDPQLVEALNLATFTDPGAIYQPVINRLSPEVHRGMADYTEQAVRSHVRQALETAPVSRSGRTQVFATAHSATDGVDSSGTDAGYDIEMTGFTSGVRYDINKRTQIGGLLGADDGSIKGGLIDTDAQGLVGGAFAQYLVDERSGTTLTASLSYGGYDFDAERQSFQGPVTADDISSEALEFSIGVRTVAYQKDGFRVTPNAALRYLDGSVDGFTESGPGVELKVGGQDIESLMLDLGVDVEYKLLEQVAIAGSLGYVTDFCDSSESINGAFASSGALGRPFTISAPGIDDEAVVLGLGVYYDFNETMRASLSYRADFRFDSEDAHTIGIGASFGF